MYERWIIQRWESVWYVKTSVCVMAVLSRDLYLTMFHLSLNVSLISRSKRRRLLSCVLRTEWVWVILHRFHHRTTIRSECRYISWKPNAWTAVINDGDVRQITAEYCQIFEIISFITYTAVAEYAVSDEVSVGIDDVEKAIGVNTLTRREIRWFRTICWCVRGTFSCAVASWHRTW